MQISKSFLVVCAVAYCAALLPLRAADADTQSKLQEALNQKLNELQTQPPASTPPPAVTAQQPKEQAAPIAAPAPAAVPAPAAQSAPAITTPPADPEAIAKAREALRQKMIELQTQTGGRPTPPAQWTPPSVAKPAPVAQPAAAPPAAQPLPPAALPVPAPAPAAQSAPKPVLIAPPPTDSETIAKAREALRQKMSELNAQPLSQTAPVTQPAPPVAQPAPAPAPAPPPVVVQPAPAPPPAVQPPPAVVQPAPAPAVQATTKPVLAAPPPAEAESIAKAREALRQKMKELDAQPPTPTAALAPTLAAPNPEGQPKTEKFSRKPAKGMQPFPPIQGPPPAVSADKQQRLTELLRKYRAEDITPEEYHQQRAKILAEP